jgi:hypothetical protein
VEIFAAWWKFLLLGGNFCCLAEIFAAWQKFLLLGMTKRSEEPWTLLRPAVPDVF